MTTPTRPYSIPPLLPKDLAALQSQGFPPEVIDVLEVEAIASGGASQEALQRVLERGFEVVPPSHEKRIRRNAEVDSLGATWLVRLRRTLELLLLEDLRVAVRWPSLVGFTGLDGQDCFMTANVLVALADWPKRDPAVFDLYRLLDRTIPEGPHGALDAVVLNGGGKSAVKLALDRVDAFLKTLREGSRASRRLSTFEKMVRIYVAAWSLWDKNEKITQEAVAKLAGLGSRTRLSESPLKEFWSQVKKQLGRRGLPPDSYIGRSGCPDRAVQYPRPDDD